MEIIKLAFFVFFGLFVPGFVLIKPLGKKNFWLNLFLSISLGFVVIALLGFVGGILDFRWLVWTVIVIFNLFFLFNKHYRLLFSSRVLLNISHFLPAVIIVLGIVFQSPTMIRSGAMYDFGIGFWGPTGRDGIWHQALVGQLIKNVPPENPGFAGEKLTNYHYFYDLLVAETHKITSVSVEDLIYRFYPVLFSLLFGIGTYYLSDVLFKNKLANYFTLFFAYFAGSFGWIVEWIKYKKLGGESAFWMNQPVSMNLNPPFAISMVLVIVIVLLFLEFQKQKNWRITFVLVLIAGVLSEFKIYAGLMVIGSLVLISLEAMIVKKDFSYLKLSIPALIIFLLLFLSKGINGVSYIEFKPLWFVHSAIDFPDRIGWMRLSSARINYYLAGNWPKFALAEVLALVIFVVGNMGMRIIGLPAALKIWKENLLSLGKYCLIFWMSLISFSVPFFFIQKGNPWNTIQFGYYFLYFSSLFAGFGLYRLSAKLSKVIVIPVVSVILLITLISSFTTFTFGLYPNPPAKLTPAEYEALNYLEKLPEGVVLTHPYDLSLRSHYKNPYPLSIYTDNDYISAFSGKSVYLGDIEQQKILQTGYQKRLNFAKDYFESNIGNQLLVDKNISYIYLPKIYDLNLNNRENLSKIFENNETLIYKVQDLEFK